MGSRCVADRQPTYTRPGMVMNASSVVSRLVVGVGLALAANACAASGGGQETIEREQFIQTYVDLRVGALTDEARQISDEARDRVLAEHGVTEDELLAFADVHGRDVDFMKDVWDEVERRLDEVRPDPTRSELEGIN